MKVPFGYDLVNGNLVINEEEAKILKYLYEKQEEYTDNPPKELVDRVLEIARERGEELTYEEAKERVSYSAILEYITREMNLNEEFIKIIKKEHSQLLTGQFKITDSTSEPIISKELWDKAQEKRKK